MSEMPPPDIFLIDQFQVALHAAALPRLYENPNNHTPWEAFVHSVKSIFSEVSEVTPMEAVRERISTEIPEYSDITIFQSGAMTVVVACDPIEGHAFIAADPTQEWRVEPFTNFDIRRINHSIGGTVLGGYYKDSLRHNKRIITDIETAILDCSNINHQNITASFTGFSQGGAKAVTLNAEMISNGVFNHQNITMGNVYQFGTPDYADNTFTQSYNSLVEDKGAQIWDIVVSEDYMTGVINSFTQKAGVKYVMKPETPLHGNPLGHSFDIYRACLYEEREKIFNKGEAALMAQAENNPETLKP